MADNEDFEALLAQFEREQAGSAKVEHKVGDQVRGKIVSIGPQYLFVDIGAKCEGMMEVGAVTGSDGNVTVNVGDSIETTVSGIDQDTGTPLLGSQHGRHLHGTAELQDAFRQQLPVEGLVTGVTKGGVEIQIAGQRAFCPASQLDLRYIEDLESVVGQRLDFRITKYEGGRHINLVVSRRELLEEEQRARAEATRARIEPGAVLEGTVTSIKDFGAFVDLGGVEGMIHVSELALGRIKHPSDVLSVGQPVEVAVLRIEKTDNPKHPEKIALSIRALAPDPWQDADRRFAAGALVKGTVTRLQPFGAFVELAPGIEGMVHISELGAGRRVTHPREVLSPGQEVEATVLGVDLEKRRVGLSLDASRQTEAQEQEQTRSYVDYAKPPEGFGTLGDLLKQTLDKNK